MLKVIIIGPESSGKTTLAGQLAAALSTRWVPEFARSYVEHLGRPYTHADLKTILTGQLAWEQWHFQQQITARQPLLICDTDWTVIYIWEKYRFGTTLPDFKPQTSNAQTLYFLCSPDFPWQPDPLREHPDERDVLFALYENLLQQINARYIVLQGTQKDRLQTAQAEVRQLL